MVIDSKDELHDWLCVDWSESAKERLMAGEPIRTRVVDTEDAYEAMELAYEAGNVTVYIDETDEIAPTPYPHKAIRDIWRRGRSRKVSGWAASQRPAYMPRIFLSEAQHFFVFETPLEDDRKRLARDVNPKLQKELTEPFTFWYYSRKSRQLRLGRLNL